MLNYITYLNMSLTAVNNGISKFDSYIEYILKNEISYNTAEETTS